MTVAGVFETLLSGTWRQRVVWLTARLVVLLGVFGLVGWVFDLDVLKRIIPAQGTMKPNTALSLVLAGAALGGCARATPRRWRVRVGAGALVVLGIALATLVEHIVGVDLGVDEWLFRDPETPRELHPGRMAGATALGLLLAGAALLLLVLGARRPAAGRVARVLGHAILAIGVLGLLGPLFHIVVLYSWYPFGTVALHTALAFILFGSGLLAAERGAEVVAPPLSEEQRITRAAALALILAAGATGIVGVAALESYVRRSAEGELQSLLNTRVTELSTNLELRTTRAAIVTTRPNLRRYLRILVAEPNNREARQVVQGVLASFLSHDFSRLVITLPSGEEVARAESDAPTTPTLEVPLAGSATARLTWRDRTGVGLRHDLVMADAEGPLGTVVAEQRVPRLTEMLLGDSTRFTSDEFLLCSPAGPVFRCFPSRLSPAFMVVSPGARDAPRLLQRALAGSAGVGTTVDYRGREVFGAYTPLRNLGLVAVLKVDMDELYGSTRRQLALALLLVVTVTVGGVALVRARVGPLAARLEQRVRQRTEDVQHANARLSILHEIDQGLLAGLTPEGIAEAILPRLRDLLGVPRVIVHLVDFETGVVEWLAAAGRRRTHLGPGIRYPVAFMGDVDALRRGVPQLMDVDALPPSPEVEALLASGVRFYVVVPMISGGELIGGVSIGGPSREFSTDQIAVAEEVARQMAIAIEHSRLLERVTRHTAELEERVQARTAELQEAQAQLVLKERLAALGQLAGSMAHELRNPLGVIKNAAYFLKLKLAAAEDAAVRKHIAIVEREIAICNRIMADLLDFARAPEARRVPTNLSEVVREYLERVGAPEGDVQLVLRLVDDLPSLDVDPVQVGQVLGNLARNAVQAMPNGGRLTIETAQLADKTLTLAVADTGAGISPEARVRLFEPLFTTKAKGVGLGLAIARQLTEANGGTIDVESVPGQGSRFSIRFPRRAGGA